MEDSAIHCIGCIDDMNALLQRTDFRVCEVKSLQC